MIYDISMKRERINIFMAEYMPENEALTFERDGQVYTLLGINLETGIAWIEDGLEIGELEPALSDEEIEGLYAEVLQRMHNQRPQTGFPYDGRKGV
jgi:hypothetical protein